MTDLVSKSLSEEDIRKYLNGKTKIISYTDIYKYKTIDELISPHNHVIILYLTKPHYGHWTLVFRYPNKNEIHFFDSYGYKPDTEFKFVTNFLFRIESKQIYHYLVKLLLDAYGKYKISYNHFQLQANSTKENRISTCGRWCLARILNNNMDEYQFYELFGGNRKNDKDLLVSKYINI